MKLRPISVVVVVGFVLMAGCASKRRLASPRAASEPGQSEVKSSGVTEQSSASLQTSVLSEESLYGIILNKYLSNEQEAMTYCENLSRFDRGRVGQYVLDHKGNRSVYFPSSFHISKHLDQKEKDFLLWYLKTQTSLNPRLD